MNAIDLEADLNMVDDEGRNVAVLRKGASLSVGSVIIAGLPDCWSWARVDRVEGDLVFFTCVNAPETARHR